MAKRAESFFIAVDDEVKKDNVEELTIDQKIKRFSINNRPKLMELPNVVGVNTIKGDNVTAVVLRVAKDANGWKECPKWLKVATNAQKIDDAYIKGYYNILNSKGEIIKVDNENINIVLQSEEASINVDSLKKAINDIGPTKKYSYYNYTKAQNYFLEFVETGNKKIENEDSINKQVKKFANQLRSKVMGLDGVTGVNVQQYNNVDYLCIIARVGKNYKKWEKIASFLKKPENKIEFKDASILDSYVIIDEDDAQYNKPIKIDNKEVLLVVKQVINEVDSLKPATNDIGPTKKYDYHNYTKSQAFFIDFDDSEKKQDIKSVESQVKQIAIQSRQEIRNIDGVIGVKTQKCKSIEQPVIVLRVPKSFKSWENVPKILQKAEDPHKNADIDNIKGWYYLLDKDGKKYTVDNDKPVLVCTYVEDFEQIDSLQPPANKINPSKKAPYSKDGK